MPMIDQRPSTYEIHPTCQIQHLGSQYEHIFGLSFKGSFVEVGAFDGMTYSNVYGLAKAGWRGLEIEPMPENLAKAVINIGTLPNVTIIPKAVSDYQGTLRMFFEREGSREGKDGEETLAVECDTLDNIIKSNGWKPDFDILVIDTEDYEQSVLKEFDLHYWRPKLCIIETHGWQRPVLHDFFSKYYTIFSEDGLNTLFWRNDLYRPHAELGVRT